MEDEYVALSIFPFVCVAPETSSLLLFFVSVDNGPPAPNGGMSDLAQAQAQLQSLQQFRAAAGGHHQKMPSFSFPNMLPNMMAANMLGIGGYNLLQQQQQQFQVRLQLFFFSHNLSA